MQRFIISIICLLLTAQLAITGLFPLFALSPILILSALVVYGHVYAYSRHIVRELVGLYVRYETMNFYRPGYKTYDERYIVALSHIAIEEIIRKLESLAGLPGQENTNIVNSTLPLAYLVVRACIMTPAFRLAALLTTFGYLVVHMTPVGSTLPPVIIIISKPVWASVITTAVVTSIFGAYQGLNMELSTFARHFNECADALRTLYPLSPTHWIVVVVSLSGTYSLLYLSTRLTRTWTIALIVATLVALCIWVYIARSRLLGYSKKAITSISRTMSDLVFGWDDTYDKEHNPPSQPRFEDDTPTNQPGRCEHLKEVVDESQPAGQRSNVDRKCQQIETRMKGLVAGGTRRRGFLPQCPCRANGSFALCRQRVALRGPEWPSPVDRTQAGAAQPTSSQFLPALFASQPSSVESVPDLTPDSSTVRSSSVPSPVSINPGLPVIALPIAPSRFSALRQGHATAIRCKRKVSPLDGPKQIVDACTAKPEQKAMAVLHRSEWKLAAKVKKERKAAKTAREPSMEVDTVLPEHFALTTGAGWTDHSTLMATPNVVPALSPQPCALSPIILCTPPRAHSPMPMLLSPQPSPSRMALVPEREAAERGGPRTIKRVPRPRRRAAGAGPSGTPTVFAGFSPAAALQSVDLDLDF